MTDEELIEQSLYREDVDIERAKSIAGGYDDEVDSYREPKQKATHGFLSEPWLRDDEAICPVTNLAYNARLGKSPYVNEKGEADW